MRPQELEERLIDFTVSIIRIADNLPNSRSGINLGNQIVRSGTSVTLNYGEARSAESEKDFIHKCQIVLKELRESYNSLRIIKKSQISIDAVVDPTLVENNELICIFVATIKKLKKSNLLKNI